MFVFVCGFVYDCVWVCLWLCVSEEKDDEERSQFLLQREEREKKKGAKQEINKMWCTRATVTVHICTVTIASV